MKIIHVYAKNVQAFVEAAKDTDCRLNASSDLDYMLNSLQNYNARDVMGLVVFANPMTKKCLKLIQAFDELFVFKKMPIIVINDDVAQLRDRGILKVKNSKLFLVTSEENSISDIDMAQIFVTLLTFSDALYDLSICPPEVKAKVVNRVGERKEIEMSTQLLEFLDFLKRSELYEDRSRHTQFFEETEEGETNEGKAIKGLWGD